MTQTKNLSVCSYAVIEQKSISNSLNTNWDLFPQSDPNACELF